MTIYEGLGVAWVVLIGIATIASFCAFLCWRFVTGEPMVVFSRTARDTAPPRPLNPKTSDIGVPNSSAIPKALEIPMSRSDLDNKDLLRTQRQATALVAEHNTLYALEDKIGRLIPLRRNVWVYFTLTALISEYRILTKQERKDNTGKYLAGRIKQLSRELSINQR